MAAYDSERSSDEKAWSPTPGRIMEAPEDLDVQLSPFSIAYGELEHEVGTVSKMISVLEDRLQIILGPELDEKAGEDDRVSGEGKSPIVQELIKMTTQVKYNRRRLGDIMNRVQL